MVAIDRVYTLGRSLGIHIVILAQDAAAAASEMIQANSRFRWCKDTAWYIKAVELMATEGLMSDYGKYAPERPHYMVSSSRPCSGSMRAVPIRAANKDGMLVSDRTNVT